MYITVDPDNPNWPLPKDYYDLDPVEQSRARVAIVSDCSTPEKELLAHICFKQWYLEDENTGFYDVHVESADFHHEWIYTIAGNRRCLFMAFRGSGKSTVCRDELVLRRLVTMPRSKTMLVLSSEDRLEDALDRIMYQIEFNERIKADFGDLKPPKGYGKWNHTKLRLTNGALVWGGGVTSRSLRGGRPHLIIVDDAEYDPKEGTNIDNVAADMRNLILRVLLPMLRKGSRIVMIATPIHSRLMAWKMFIGDEEAFSTKIWKKVAYPLLDEEGNSTWPAEYDMEWIKQRQLELGDAFKPEMMVQPGSDEEHPIEIDPVLNEYTWADTEEASRRSLRPLESVYQIEWNDCMLQANGQTSIVARVGKAGEVFSKMRRFITVDYAPTVKSSSDRSVVHVMGIDRYNQIWSLDMWSGRLRSDALIDKIWEMAMKWEVRIIGVEAVAIQYEFFLQVRDRIDQMALQGRRAPQVKDITYGTKLSKADRIGALNFRFRRGLVKLPRPLKRKMDCYARLYDQLLSFTASQAGMTKDDEVDTLAMYSEIVPQAAKNHDTGMVRESLTERVRRGDTQIDGVPIGQMVPLEQMSGELLGLLMSHYYKHMQPAQEDDNRRWESAAL